MILRGDSLDLIQAFSDTPDLIAQAADIVAAAKMGSVASLPGVG